MPTQTQPKETNDNGSAMNVRLYPEYLAPLTEVAIFFGYGNKGHATAARNCVEIGLKIFKDNQEKFRQMLVEAKDLFPSKK